MLNICNEIENALKSNGLVGTRIGSGFCFMDGGCRDVQYEYGNTKNTNAIEQTANSVIEKYPEFKIRYRFKDEDFSFYVSPKNPPKTSSDGIPEDHE